MKNNYILSLSLMTLFASGVFAQDGKKYNSDNAYQKTIKLENNLTKENAIVEFGKKYDLDKNNVFEAKSETSDASGLTHQRHQQFYKGLKVEFGTVITHSREGRVETVNGELYDAKNLNIKPTLSATEGFNKATNFIGAQKYLWEDTVGANSMDYAKPTGELVIFPMVNSGKICLAYKYDLYATAPLSRDEVFVDAHTGEILYRNPIIKHAQSTISSPSMNARAEEAKAKIGEAILLGTTDKLDQKTISTALIASTAATRYSGTKTIESNLSGANYILYEANRTTNGITGNGVRTYNSGKTPTYPTTDFINATTSWTTGNYAAASATKDNAALDAHWGAEKVFDWWATVYNRNSYDDAGAQIKSWVHYDDVAGGLGYDNAFWNGTGMTYGDGNTFNVLTALDVCGHEIGHAVCTYTAGLAYQNHSGAMNEGLSDIWGSCIEWWARNGNFNMPADGANPGTQASWKIGEDITTGGLRSMSWPRSKGNPDTYKGISWTGTSDDGVACTPVGPGQAGANDYCGVHNNSGVLNHWFYLLTIGKTSWTNNAVPTRITTTTGIGMQKSSQITYLAERDYLTANSTYTDMRNATIAVANSLYCASSPEVQAVTKSWYAVNIGADYVGYTNDVSLKSLTGTSSIACGAPYSASLVFENAGSANITSVTVSYTIDGGAAVNNTWTGTLTNCSTQVYPLTITGLTRGTHILSVTTTIISDGNATNNTKTSILTVNNNGSVNTVNAFSNTSDALVSIDSNGKANTVWQRGTVNKTPLTSVATGNSAGYVTKLVGNYPDKTTSYLVSQCYDLTNMSNPSVNFDMAFDLESNWDIIYFEYSTNSGANWNVLGTSADANWYNSSRLPDAANTAESCFNCIGKQWTGLYATAPIGGTGVNGNKRNYSHTLTPFGFGGATPASNIMFRFNFVSDDNSNNTGVFIDNFIVQGVLSTTENQFESFGVYPNPSNGVFNLVLSTSEKVNITLHDLRGRSIYNETFSSNGSVFNKELNFSTLSSGIYMLNVDSAGKKASKKIIIN
ncbi:M4 family metallopeptidase [Flavobacterium sp.]|uniref:M4 family metallopeptidase n=1 Tax=Flavobacterium sp. TaxID=239 RepID=UPI003751989B